MRNLMMIAPLLGMFACGGADPTKSCEDYVAAYTACFDEMGTGTPAVDDTFCTAYSDLKGDEASTAADYLDCLAAAYNDADCSTAEGLATAGTASLDCTVTAE